LATETYVAGIDIGTTKVCTVIGSCIETGQFAVLGVGLVPSTGLRAGIVVDRADAAEAIRQSVQKAEQMAGLPVQVAYIGITGDHTRSANVVGRVHTGPDGEVTAEDVEQVKQSAIDSVPLPADREIVHTIVRDFSLDGTSGVSRPIGMSGRRLDVLLHVVTGLSAVIANVRQCALSAGVEVQAHILEPIATARAVLTDAERDLGVLIIDIGGGTSDIAVFVNGAICHSAAVPVASNRITRDIAEVLRVSTKDAEALKCRFGAAVPDLVAEDDLVHVTKADGLDFERVPRRLIAEIMEARLIETFEMVKNEIARAPIPKVGGVVLSGGGSQAPGIVKLASRAFDGMPVRTSEPRNVGGLTHLVGSPVYATGVGLGMIAADEGASAFKQQAASSNPADTVRSWARELWAKILQYKPW